MGNVESSSIPRHRQVKLIPQAQPVTPINARFCEPRVMQLRRKHRILHGPAFRELSADTTRFKCKLGSLIDATKKPILTFKWFAEHKRVSVYPGGNSVGRALFQIRIEYIFRCKPVVQVEFTDITTGEKCELGLEGDWRNHDAYFWLDRGRRGVREPVAKIYRVPKKLYHFDIAPNMDTAMITMICRAIEFVVWSIDLSENSS